MLAGHLRDFDEILAFQVFDGAGKALYHSGPAAPLARVGEQEWFRHLVDRPGPELVFSGVLLEQPTTPVLVVARRLKAEDGRILGAVGAVVDLNRLKRELDGLEIGSHGLIVIRQNDDDRLVLRRPGEPGWFNQSISSPIRRRIHAGEREGVGDQFSPLDHVERRFAFRVAATVPFSVVVAIARDDYLAGWSRQTGLFATAAGILLTALAVLLVGQLRSEETVRRMSRYLQSVLASSSEVSIIATDRDGLIVLFNPGAERMLGYAAEDVVGRHTPTLFHAPEAMIERKRELGDGAGSADEFRFLVDRAEAVGYERREVIYLRKDGSRLTVSLAITPVRTEEGEIIGYLGIGIDLSGRAAAEEALREKEERLRILAANAPDLIWRNGPQGNVIDVSGAHEALLGLTIDELRGHLIRDLAHPDDLPLIRDFNHRMKEDDGRHAVTARLRHKDGHYIWTESTGQALRDETGHIIEIVAVSRDVTRRQRAEEGLRASEERYRMLTDNVSDVIWRTGPDGVVTDVVGAHEAILGHSSADLLGQRLVAFVHPADMPRAREFAERIDCSLRSERVELRFRHKDGQYLWVETNGRALRDKTGRIVEWVATSRDISQRKDDEKQLRLAATIFNGTQEGITITDMQGQIITVNPAFCTITGYSEAELIGKNPRVLKSGRHDSEFYRRMFGIIAAEGYWQGEIWNRRKNCEIYPEWLTVSSVRDERGKVTNYIGTFIDITRVKQSEAQLEHLAHHDPLTDLPNRLLLLSRLQHAIGRARRDGTRGAVLFLDLDHFKNVNDSMGHSIGDQLLQMVAKRYLARLRDTDTLCRMGGDEFVVLLENLKEPQHAAGVAQTLIEELREPFVLSAGVEVYVGTSIGVSVFPDDSGDADQIISNADAAMYLAKDAGRNAFRFYTEALTRAANERVELEAALRRALERDEFLLHYQPLVAVDDLRVTGVEALVRWQRPGVGLVPPLQFIPLAEETGLIVPMGAKILRAACLQMKAWLDAGTGIRTMAVNLSAHQFKQPDLCDQVRTILEETGLPARFLELEITESALMDHAIDAERKLHALKVLGVRLSIDDFGTGYSSLAYLKRFPIDKLKIDGSFVQDIPNDAADMEIVAAVVALAKSLKLEVLAEGVETPAQLAFLREQLCGAAQGYLFGRPLPPAELIGILCGDAVTVTA